MFHLYMGCTNNDLCPISTLSAYLASSVAITIKEGGDGPLFQLTSGQPLTGEQFVAKIHKATKTSISYSPVGLLGSSPTISFNMFNDRWARE